MTSQEEYDTAYNYDPDFWGNPEPQEQQNEQTGNPLGLRITFLNRRGNEITPFGPIPIEPDELHQFYLDRNLLNVLTPGYILYPSEQNERNKMTIEQAAALVGHHP